MRQEQGGLQASPRACLCTQNVLATCRVVHLAALARPCGSPLLIPVASLDPSFPQRFLHFLKCFNLSGSCLFLISHFLSLTVSCWPSKHWKIMLGYAGHPEKKHAHVKQEWFWYAVTESQTGGCLSDWSPAVRFKGPRVLVPMGCHVAPPLWLPHTGPSAESCPCPGQMCQQAAVTQVGHENALLFGSHVLRW